ncbi:MAG TPA: WD40 repeat domain-containing protein [Planctomycetaceae bacterium]|jgi:WD40 repeat protein
MRTPNGQIFSSVYSFLGTEESAASAPARRLVVMAGLLLASFAVTNGAEPPSQKPTSPAVLPNAAAPAQPGNAAPSGTTLDAALQIRAHDPEVRFVLFSKNGRHLYTGGNDNLVKSWELPGGMPRQTLKGHAAVVCCGALSPDGKVLVTGSWDGTLRAWDTETGKPQGTFIGQASPIAAVAFSPDGKSLASAGGGRIFCLWNFSTRKLTYTSPEQELTIKSIRYSPDGELLATATGDWENWKQPGEVKLWKAATGEELQLLPGHKAQVNAVAFSSDGKHLATGACDGNVRIWDVADRTLVGTANVRGCVWAVEYFPDDARLAVAQWPGQVLVWNLTNARMEAVALGHEKGKMIYSLAISPDGSSIASGSADGTARTWSVALPE